MKIACLDCSLEWETKKQLSKKGRQRARAYLRKDGWHITPSLTLCPDCAKIFGQAVTAKIVQMTAEALMENFEQ